MNKKIIIQIPFNVFGFNIKNEMDKKWMRYRLQIFRKYNMESLKNQTSQYFTALLRCRDITIPYIKKEIAGKLPENILIVGVNEYHQKMQELIKDYNYLYLIRMDSDDMYEKNFIDMLHNYNPREETEVLINQKCYMYDINRKRLVSYFWRSPPAYTLIYKTIKYNNGERYHLKNGHGGAILLKHEILPGRNFMSTLHSKNNSPRVVMKYIKTGIEIKKGVDIENILKDFGIPGKEELKDENRK